MNCNTTHYRANSSSVPGDPTVNVPAGDALGALNTQQYAFQFGVKPSGLPFLLRARLTGPFFNNQAPQGSQSQGVYLGTGDQDNYIKVVLNANGGAGGIQVVYENAGVAASSQYPISGGIPGSTLELLLKFNPATNSVQAAYAASGGATINVGTPIAISGALLNALRGTTVLAAGVIATSKGGPTFTATWDYLYLETDVSAAAGSWQTLTPASGNFTGREENAYVQAGTKFYLVGGRGNKPVQEYNPATKAWVDKASQPLELHHFQALTLGGLVYVVGAFTGPYPHETPVPNVYLYNPASNQWLTGPPIPQARRRGAAGAAVYNNKIYIVGGITDGHWAGWVKWFDVYDPATNAWSTLPDAPRERDHVQVTVVGSKLYVAGGRRSSASTGQDFELTVPEVDVYDFSTGTWSTLPAGSNIPTPRAGASNVVLGNEVIVIGGESGAQTAAHAETEALDVTTNTWRRLASLQQGRHGTQAIANNGGIYTATGAGNRGGTPILTTQEAFYFFSPTAPTGTPLTQSSLSAPASLAFGSVAVNGVATQSLVLANTTGNQSILISSIAVTGAAAFTWSAPGALPFVLPAGQSVTITVAFRPTASGSQTASLVVGHSGQNASTTTALSGTGGGTTTAAASYRINAGGGAVSNSIGNFAADNYFSPAPGNVNDTTAAINNTADDSIYQSERWGNSFGYAFPVVNGQYKVVLHFAEIYWTTPGSRVFDVSIEGVKLLDNYDIVAKVGAFTATTETFTVSVADGTLNIDFSSLTATGGMDNAKVSAIEVLPVTNNTQSLSSFTLVNASNEQDIQTLTNGATINLATLPSRSLNIRANTAPATVGSVVFALSGTQTRNANESGAPYALYGDNAGDYNPWTPAVGSYTLKATPYTGSGGSGTAGTPLTITFTVTDQAGGNQPPVANAGADKALTLPANSTTLNGSGTDAGGSITGYSWSQVSGPNTASFSSTTVAAPTVGGLVQGSYVFALVVTDNQGASSAPDQVTVTVSPAATTPAVSSFTLVNAGNEQDIQALTNGATLNLATLPGRSLNIRANTSPSVVGKVIFNLTGAQVRNQTETGAPYALYGDNSGNYNGWTPVVGTYTLKATPYTSSGVAGSALTITFTVVDQAAAPALARAGDKGTNTETIAADELSLVVYPNPSGLKRVSVQFARPLQGTVFYSLYTAAGVRTLQGRRELPAAARVMSLDFSREGLAAGVYFLEVVWGGRKATTRVVLYGRAAR